MDTGKEGYFGLPEDLFLAIVAYLQVQAAPGAPAAAAALLALAALAAEEHAAAVSRYQPRLIDVVFKAIELKADLEALQNVPTASLPAALAAFTTKLNKLAAFWKG
jgi:hypothetical protein